VRKAHISILKHNSNLKRHDVLLQTSDKHTDRQTQS